MDRAERLSDEYKDKLKEITETREQRSSLIRELQDENKTLKTKTAELHGAVARISEEKHSMFADLASHKYQPDEQKKRLDEKSQASRDLLKKIQQLETDRDKLVKEHGLEQQSLTHQLKEQTELTSHLTEELNHLKVQSSEQEIKSATIKEQLEEKSTALKEISLSLTTERQERNQLQKEHDAVYKKWQTAVDSLTNFQKAKTQLEAKLRASANKLQKQDTESREKFDGQVKEANQQKSQLAALERQQVAGKNKKDKRKPHKSKSQRKRKQRVIIPESDSELDEPAPGKKSKLSGEASLRVIGD